MSSVYFDPAVGGDGSTVSDDSNGSTGLASGGHRTRFVPALSQVVSLANFAKGRATEADASAIAAEESAILASEQVSLASDQVALATTQAGNAVTSAGIATAKAGEARASAEDAAQSATEAAASAASIAGGPVASLNGQGGAINIKSIDGKSLMGSGELTVMPRGATLFSSTPLSVPDFLPADGSSFLSASYPDLFNQLTTAPIPVGGAPLAISPVFTDSNSTQTISSDGLYAAFGLVGIAESVQVYKNVAGTYTKLAALPSPIGAVTISSIAFSEDTNILAVCALTSPYIFLWRRTGDTFARLANPGTLPVGNATCCAFSKDGTYLAVSHVTTPFITIYKIEGDVFTKLANPASLPASASAGNGCIAWSSDGTYMALTCGSTPYNAIYKRAADVFTKLAGLATTPDGSATGMAFSQDDSKLAVAGASANSWIYTRSGDVFTLSLSNLPKLQFSIKYTSDNKYLIGAASGTAPYLHVLGVAKNYAETPPPYGLNPAVAVVGSAVFGNTVCSNSGEYIISRYYDGVSRVLPQAWQMGASQASFVTPIITPIGSVGEVKGYIKS